MTTRPWAALLATLMALVFISGPFRISAQAKGHSRTKWEYKIVQVQAKPGFQIPVASGVTTSATVPGVISEKELNTLGEQGWELFRIAGGQSIPKHDSFSPTVYYFKRPK